jgi:conjugal transfer ATP-binding protein TraC
MIEKILKIFGEEVELDEHSKDKGFSVHHLHTFLPYDSYDPATGLFYNQNATGFVLRGYPLVGASIDHQQQLAAFFRQHQHMPEGSSLQCLLIGSPRVGPMLDYWVGARERHVQDILQKKKEEAEKKYGPNHKEPVVLTKDDTMYLDLAHKRQEFLAKKAVGLGRPQLLDHHILISMTFPECVKDPAGVESITETRAALENALKDVQMFVERLDAEMFLQEMSNLLNFSKPFHNEHSQWNEHIPLNKQIISPEHVYIRKATGVNIDFGKKLVKTFIPKNNPKSWGLGHMDRLFGDLLLKDSQIPCPFWLHYGLTVSSNQGAGKARIALKRESLDNMMKNKLGKFVSGLPERYEEVDSCLNELNSGERLIYACLSMTLFTEPENMRKAEAKLRSIWNAAGWEATPNTCLHLEMMLSCLPMTWTMGPVQDLLQGQLTPVQTGWGPDLLKMGRAKETITREAQNMLPIIGEWKGQLAPGMPLFGRRGQLFFWNPFGTAFEPNAKNVKTDHNFNLCIAGQSGSGKSVFMQELVMSTLGIGGKVFVLDYGRSFKRTCNLLKGQHIEFDLRVPISMNPFRDVPNGDSPEDGESRNEMLAAIRSILQVMASPKKGTEDKENARLERALHEVWEMHGQNTTIDHIYENLRQDPDINYRQLGDMLYSFTSKGSYGKFFAGDSHATFNADMVVIETDHLRSFPQLMAVLVQMMILHIQQTMARGNRKQPFLIIIDEAWQLLAGKDTADFISGIARTSRKYKGALVLATQHLTDYFKPTSPAATEAFQCSAWRCVLYQEADTIRGLKGHPQLGAFVDHELKEALLTSVKADPPHYSEVSINGPGINGVIGRLALDDFSRYLYSTTANEVEAIDTFVEQGYSITEAIELTIEKFEPGRSHD